MSPLSPLSRRSLVAHVSRVTGPLGSRVSAPGATCAALATRVTGAEGGVPAGALCCRAAGPGPLEAWLPMLLLLLLLSSVSFYSHHHCTQSASSANKVCQTCKQCLLLVVFGCQY